MGRLVSYKGLPVLLEALQYAPGHLWIAGTGPLEKRLRRQAIEGKLEDRVKFLGGSIEIDSGSITVTAITITIPINGNGRGEV